MSPMTAIKPPVKLKPPEPDDPAVVLTFADLTEIGLLLKKNLRDKETLVKAIQAASSVSVEGASITLESRLLQRLKTRCLDKGNFHNWLKEVVVKQLHDYAGY